MAPPQPVPGQTPPHPALVPVLQLPPKPPSHSPSTPPRRLHHRHLGLEPHLLCPGPATRERAGASPSTTPRTTAPGRPGPGRPAPAATPPPASSPARPLQDGSPGHEPGLSPAHKSAQARAGGRGSRTSWLPGLLFEQNQRGSRAARAGPGRTPCAREAPAWAALNPAARVGRAPPGARQARPLPCTLGRKSGAAGPGRRGRGAARGPRRHLRGGSAAAAAAAAARCPACALSAARAFSLRAPRWPARPPPRFPPARPALAPSARLRCRVNWNQSPRPRDSHNAQRAARHIPSRPRASGHPSRATWAPQP